MERLNTEFPGQLEENVFSSRGGDLSQTTTQVVRTPENWMIQSHSRARIREATWVWDNNQVTRPTVPGKTFMLTLGPRQRDSKKRLSQDRRFPSKSFRTYKKLHTFSRLTRLFRVQWASSYKYESQMRLKYSNDCVTDWRRLFALYIRKNADTDITNVK